MGMPAYVGAGSGVAIENGSANVEKTSCTAGNLLLVHMLARGSTEDWGGGPGTNIKKLDGTADYLDAIVTGSGVGSGSASSEALFIGRVVANGTCTYSFAVGASGEDLYARMYEFSGATTGSTIASVVENDASTYDALNGTSTTIDSVTVITNSTDRLACHVVAIAANQAVASFTGETGGDWTEAVAEYATSTGAAATLQLQTAEMASAGTIDNGTITITSADWGGIGLAIIPAAPAQVMLVCGMLGTGRV